MKEDHKEILINSYHIFHLPLNSRNKLVVVGTQTINNTQNISVSDQ